VELAILEWTLDQLADGYAELTQVVRPAPTPRIVADPDDDVVIGTALAAMLVTGDRALLDVGAYQGMRIVSVAEAIGLITTG